MFGPGGTDYLTAGFASFAGQTKRPSAETLGLVFDCCIDSMTLLNGAVELLWRISGHAERTGSSGYVAVRTGHAVG